jgi:hypothetical protein
MKLGIFVFMANAKDDSRQTTDVLQETFDLMILTEI